MIQNSKFKIQNLLRRGAATLPVVLIVSAIIMEIAITSVIVSSIFGGATLNNRLASEALSTAQAGASDGIIRVLRYCPIGSIAGTICASPYEVVVENRTADVIIKDDPGPPSGSGNKIIISSSTILNRVKRVEAKLSIDQITGKTDIRSFKECYNYDGEYCTD